MRVFGNRPKTSFFSSLFNSNPHHNYIIICSEYDKNIVCPRSNGFFFRSTPMKHNRPPVKIKSVCAYPSRHHYPLHPPRFTAQIIVPTRRPVVRRRSSPHKYSIGATYMTRRKKFMSLRICNYCRGCCRNMKSWSCMNDILFPGACNFFVRK